MMMHRGGFRLRRVWRQMASSAGVTYSSLASMFDNPNVSSNPTTSFTETKKDEYDVVVVGGGSGGLSFAKEAALLGQKVAVLDYVTPSAQGSVWGLGGTCVNVGCIPKKLMHHSASLGEAWKHDSRGYGWLSKSTPAHNWGDMVRNIQMYIRSLNFGYQSELANAGIDYINALGSIEKPTGGGFDGSTELAPLRVVASSGSSGSQGLGALFNASHAGGASTSQDRVLTARKHVCIAVGGRPNSLDIPGGDLALTSDDLFSQRVHPGKTLVIGASYVALECAGFLAGFGGPVPTVMARSIFLRGFDQQMAGVVSEHMEAHCGVRMLRKCTPVRMEEVQNQDGVQIRVHYRQADGEVTFDDFDTVFSAVGRHPTTESLGLEHTAVQVAPSGHIVSTPPPASEVHSPCEHTHDPRVVAIGDVVQGVPELTPAAIQAGRVLAGRLYSDSQSLVNPEGKSDASQQRPKSQMLSGYVDYASVPTTIFTPLEYSCVGLSEEAAIDLYGEGDVEVYHSKFAPLEHALSKPSRGPDTALGGRGYLKILALGSSADAPVLGLHYAGPNAAEVMQGFATAFRLRLTVRALFDTVGIHPSCAEEFVGAFERKSEGGSGDAGGGC